MIKAVIFDFDGVIVESIDIKTAAFAKLFEREGRKAVKKVVEYHLANAGVSRYEKFRHIYREILKRDLSKNEFKKLCDRFASLVVESVVRAPYVKGAYQFLKKHAAKYKFFVTSATPQEEIEEIIKKRSIADFFSAVYGAPTMKSDAVKYILKKKGLRPSSIVYIGDALSDYKVAQDNHINFIARIYKKNKGIFSGIDYPRIKDLVFLEKTIRRFGKGHDSL